MEKRSDEIMCDFVRLGKRGLKLVRDGFGALEGPKAPGGREAKG